MHYPTLAVLSLFPPSRPSCLSAPLLLPSRLFCSFPQAFIRHQLCARVCARHKVVSGADMAPVHESPVPLRCSRRGQAGGGVRVHLLGGTLSVWEGRVSESADKAVLVTTALFVRTPCPSSHRWAGEQRKPSTQGWQPTLFLLAGYIICHSRCGNFPHPSARKRPGNPSTGGVGALGFLGWFPCVRPLRGVRFTLFFF